MPPLQILFKKVFPDIARPHASFKTFWAFALPGLKRYYEVDMANYGAVDEKHTDEYVLTAPVKFKRRASLNKLSEAWSLRRRLIAMYRGARKRAAEGLAVSACQKLLLNDFYTVEKQLALLIKGLEDMRALALPAFTSGVNSGEPRVFAAAEQLVALRSAVCNEAAVKQFIARSGTELDFTHDELCALPVALKLALMKALYNNACGDEQSELFIKNAMLSMRALDDVQWDELIEDVSSTVRLLSQRPEFSELDRQSRAYCLQKIKRIAKSLNCSEADAARTAVELAQKGSGKAAHIGYYIQGEGEELLRCAVSPEKPRLPMRPNNALLLYCLGILALTDALMLLLSPAGKLTSLLAFYPALTVAISVISRLFIRISRPRFVLRRIPSSEDAASCAAAMPVLLTDDKAVTASVQRLEAHYLANPIDGVRFILLADLKDADVPETEKDDALLDLAKQGVKALNSKYGSRFILLCRERKQKPDGTFSGYERKRGAVMELCRMLCGRGGEFKTEYPAGQYRAKYLAVLDSDTVLPNGSLQKMLGAAALSINRPVISRGRSKEGYSVFVPNVRTTAKAAAKSLFAGLFAGDAGAEPYSASISNLHMDLFASGDFGGKGMIITEPFYRLLCNAVPPETVLSHDLLEGSIAGAAFLNDVNLYDEQPHTLPRWWKRQERWIRGDWQLLPYILGTLRGKLQGVLPRVKMLGNIVRSLREPVTLALLIISICLKLPWLYFAAVAAFMFEPFKCLVMLAAKSITQKQHFSAALLLALRCFTELIALPYSAVCAFTAIAKALYRQLVSHKNMLQWQTNASADEKAFAFVNITAAAVLAALTAVFAGGEGLFLLRFGGVLLSAAWLIGVPIVRMLDRERRPHEFSEGERQEIMRLFEGAWRFFSENCNEASNFLPPDNVQHDPSKPAVQRTSPTNIGMALLANICAYDVGVIDKAELLRRTEGTVAAVEKLDKWQGNLYNWYSTLTLCPLAPLGAYALKKRCTCLVEQMKLEALFDDERKLFYIGRDIENGSFTPSHYDLYASEARILSFVSIALGKVEVSHWRRISRIMRVTEGGRVLLSWSGTAFEYLMPLIFFQTVPGSLQHEVCLSAVRTQVLKQSANGLPWGISECGYYCFDDAMYYRYRAFGEPSLGLEPNAQRHNIFAPYASALALYLEPVFALDNLRHLEKLGCMGAYGMYEAIDYTADGTASPNIVASFMAHHKGMELCAYAAALKDGGIAKRFMSLPCVRAYEELLFEHMPIDPVVIKEYENSHFVEPKSSPQFAPVRTGGGDGVLDGQLLSNGRCSVHVFADGTSRSYIISDSDNVSITDMEGLRVLVKAGDDVISCADTYCFEPHRAEFTAKHKGLTFKWDTVTAAAEAAELHELKIINNSGADAPLRVGIFYRPALCTERELKAHPSFLKLRTEAERHGDCLLFRMRGASYPADRYDEKEYNKSQDASRGLWQYAALAGAEDIAFSSDGFTSPGRLVSPEEAMRRPFRDKVKKRPIEPYFTASVGLVVAKGESAVIKCVLGCAPTREEALTKAAELIDDSVRQRRLAASVTAGLMRSCGVTSRQAAQAEPLAARLAVGLPFKPKSGFAAEDDLNAASQGMDALWSLGISGDLPIMLVDISQNEGESEGVGFEAVKRLAAFSRYCRRRGLRFDIVLLTRASPTYGNRTWGELNEATGNTEGVFVLSYGALSPSQLKLLRSAALVSCKADSIPYGSCALDKGGRESMRPVKTQFPSGLKSNDLYCQNGYGGFDTARREYVINLSGKPTPAPWCNVLANEAFGSVVTENGGGWTWFKNSRLKRLTAWEDDPMTDPVHERVLLYEGNEVMSLTPCGRGDMRVRHGLGYTSFACAANDLEAELTVFVHPKVALKFFKVKLINRAFKKRSLRLRLEVDWALGESPLPQAQITKCEGGIQKVYNPFVDLDGCTPFIAGGTADANGVYYPVDMEEGAAEERTFIMGAEWSESIPAIAEKYTTNKAAGESLEKLSDLWAQRLSRLTCHTGNKDFDLLVNGILLYQTYSSRLFAKAGFYQNGGAVGFRDRLQDVTALLYTCPIKARQAVVEAAAHQFAAGDVLHWWHNNGMGVRTRITDDRLFLPYAAMEYALVTDDDTIWDEQIPYLKEEPIPQGKRDLYKRFAEEGSGTLFEHCRRAVDASLCFGAHGLPLMDGGDWNDGMDKVGDNGGESCFNGWLLIFVLERFIGVCNERGEHRLAERYREESIKLRTSLEERTWDADRYLRAFYADGTPLGSAKNECCALDAVSQCWAVFCGAEHAGEAFDTLLSGLVESENGIVKLLAPPFSGGGAHRAGYIENYVEGVRENGAQYTHAASWALIASCLLGRGDTASRLFDMIDPIAHGSALSIERYRVEPYVLAGDVYSGEENAGRGGWTWYTGAAAWLYRAMTEHMLGLKKRGDRLYINPVNSFESFAVDYRYSENTLFRINAKHTGAASVTQEGKNVVYVKLTDDGKEHEVEVTY